VSSSPAWVLCSTSWTDPWVFQGDNDDGTVAFPFSFTLFLSSYRAVFIVCWARATDRFAGDAVVPIFDLWNSSKQYGGKGV
jgi:hypothetical protein